MLKLLFKNWWMLLLKGGLLILFGILAMLNPGITLTVFVVWFAIFMMFDGVISLIGVLSNWKTEEDKWLLVAEGILSLLLGFLVYRTPETFVSFIAFLISFWAIFSGISRIAMAIQLRKEIEGEGWLILSGILSILFGIIVFAQPGIGIATLMMIIAVFAIIVGILLIMLSLKLRKSGKLIEEKAAAVKAGLTDLKNKMQP
jgi:uncharacterized membrane protein HdeD (DUF308 family)